MDDAKIIDLYWKRDEQAIVRTDKKYGVYCKAIARNIVANPSDIDECINDTWMGAWNAMPSERPTALKAFIGKICRNTSLKRWRTMSAQKRGGGEVALSLDELTECVAGDSNAERDALDKLEFERLVRVVDSFLSSLSSEARRIFVCRYWYFDSLSSIAERFGFTESKVKMTLKRTRDALAVCLQQEGVIL